MDGSVGRLPGTGNARFARQPVRPAGGGPAQPPRPIQRVYRQPGVGVTALPLVLCPEGRALPPKSVTHRPNSDPALVAAEKAVFDRAGCSAGSTCGLEAGCDSPRSGSAPNGLTHFGAEPFGIQPLRG